MFYLELYDVGVLELFEQRDLTQSGTGNTVIFQLHLNFLSGRQQNDTPRKRRGAHMNTA